MSTEGGVSEAVRRYLHSTTSPLEAQSAALLFFVYATGSRGLWKEGQAQIGWAERRRNDDPPPPPSPLR